MGKCRSSHDVERFITAAINVLFISVRWLVFVMVYASRALVDCARVLVTVLYWDHQFGY